MHILHVHRAWAPGTPNYPGQPSACTHRQATALAVLCICYTRCHSKRLACIGLPLLSQPYETDTVVTPVSGGETEAHALQVLA